MTSVEDIKLMIETAHDIVSELHGLTRHLDGRLNEGAAIDEVVSILEAKKERVDSLRQLSSTITSELRIDQAGRPSISIPEDLKMSFGELMMELRQLIEAETKLECLLCSKGIPISGRMV